jgi:hypothetical protein
MRQWIDLVVGTAQPASRRTQLFESSRSILLEFAGDQSRQLSRIVASLQSRLGSLRRMGGEQRIYDVEGTGKRGAIFVPAGRRGGIGLAWTDIAAGIDTIHVWNRVSTYRSPDYEIILPKTGAFEPMVIKIIELIRSQAEGQFEIKTPTPDYGDIAPATAPAPAKELAFAEAAPAIIGKRTRVSPQQYMQIAREVFPDPARRRRLSVVDLQAIADHGLNGQPTQTPTSIKNDPNLKSGPHTWDLSGGEGEDAETTGEMSAAAGGPIEATQEPDPEMDTLIKYNKAKEMDRLVKLGKVVILGKNLKGGAFYKIPGIDQYTAQLERLMARELEAGGTGRKNMEEQYSVLTSRVKLIAGGQSKFVKSLLVTGAPSSGKTYNVMRVISQLGLVEGRDFLKKKGSMTAATLFRMLIEQANGMIILDDCDSIWDDKDGVNMLKGALDTEDIREIDNDKTGAINTAVMTFEERVEYTNRLSRCLRRKPNFDDADYFEQFVPGKILRQLKKAAKIEDEAEYDENGEPIESNNSVVSDGIIEFVCSPSRYPNKIVFNGRMIFISNLNQDELDSAVTSRAFLQHLEFSDLEMLDYIEKIQNNMDASHITPEQKSEVINYIREVWTTGKLSRTINFRLVLAAFDMRLMDNWKELINDL